MPDCLFCKIVNKELPSKIVYEDDLILAFNDIHPLAPVHVLFIPKEHIESLRDIEEKHKDLLGRILLAISKTARKLGIHENGYKVAISNGRDAGQEVMHMHIHLLGGWEK